MGEHGEGDAESGYREQYRVYAARFGASERTVKRWVALGKSTSDRCPLDDAEKLAAWWQRHMKQRVPEEILRARPLLELPIQAPVLELAPEVEIPQDEAPFEETEMGIEKTLARLSIMELRLSRNAAQPGQTKGWLDTIARIGPLTKQLREENEKLGKLIPKNQAEQVLMELLQPVEREIRLLYRSMCAILGLPPSPEKEGEWNQECDRIFARCQEEVFR